MTFKFLNNFLKCNNNDSDDRNILFKHYSANLKKKSIKSLSQKKVDSHSLQGKALGMDH